MTLRAKSKAQQWSMWLGAALVATAVYVVLARVLCDSDSLDILDPRHYRFALPLAVAFVVFAWETRWDGVKREKKVKVKGEGEEKGRGTVGRDGPYHPTVQQEEIVHCSPSPSTFTSSPPSACTPPQPISSLPGEAEYAEARAMPHQKIPEYGYDDEYLEMLEKSAELGYPRALAKLGEYAMRRGWNVEAYYWLWRAKKGGMDNLERMMMQVRGAWTRGGYSREQANTSRCFPYEQGTVGYALLCIDARHNADAAKARLAECAPEFLVGG